MYKFLYSFYDVSGHEINKDFYVWNSRHLINLLLEYGNRELADIIEHQYDDLDSFDFIESTSYSLIKLD